MQSSSFHLSRCTPFGLVAIVLLGAALRGWQSAESLWLDELHTGWTVAETWSDVLPRARIGNQAPGYFWLVRGWTQLFGHSEISLRFPSLLAGVLLIPAIFWVVKQGTGCPLSPLLCALLAAVDPHFVFFSQEARPYALAQLVALGQYVCFVRLLEHGPRTRLRLIFIATTLLGFYLHYTTLVLLSGELFVWLVCAVSPRRWEDATPHTSHGGTSSRRQLVHAYGGRNLTRDLTVVLIGILPACPHLWSIAQRRDNWAAFIGQPGPLAMIQLLSLDLYLGLPIVWLVISRLRKTQPPQRTTHRLTLACWFGAPLLLLWSLNWLDIVRLFHRRYLIAVGVGPLLLGGFWLARMSPPSRTRIAAALLVLAVLRGGMVQQWIRDGRLIAERNQDWRGAVAFLNNEAENTAAGSRLVLVGSGLIESNDLPNGSQQLVEYCLLPVRGPYRLETSYRLAPLARHSRNPLRPAWIREIVPDRGHWALFNSRRANIQQRIAGWRGQWQSRGWRVSTTARSFGSLTLIEVRLQRVVVVAAPASSQSTARRRSSFRSSYPLPTVAATRVRGRTGGPRPTRFAGKVALTEPLLGPVLPASNDTTRVGICYTQAFSIRQRTLRWTRCN